ncbi:hypothetical protein Tco_0211465 [Tanacetum coccineum]
MKAICNLDVPVDFKAPKPSSQTEEVPQGKKHGDKSGLRRKKSSKHTSESKTEPSKSKTSQLEKATRSSSAMDKSPSHPSPSTPMVGEMHKETQQAAGGLTSLGATSEEGSHLQLCSGTKPSVLVDQTKSAGDGLKTVHTDSGTNKESRADDISKKIKLEDLSNLLKDTRSVFFTPDSPQDEPIIVSDESEEEEEFAKDKDTHASSHDVPEDTSIPHPPSLKSAQIQELMAHELSMEFQALLVLVSSVQKQLKTLDSLSSLLNKDVPSAGQATASPAEGEKNTTKDAQTNLQNELVDLLGIDVGPISQKVYREDGTIEGIANLKVSDLHLAEWREVVQACPDRKEKGWKTIYGLIKTRMEYLDQTERELKVDFNKPLKEQDPLNELNELANKKRKRSSDLKDHSRSTKKHKSSSSA